MELIHRMVGSIILCLALAGVAQAQSADVSAGRDGGIITLTVTVHPALHAQSHTPLDDGLIPLVVKPAAANGVSWGEITYPAPAIETLPSLGKISVYVGTVKIKVAVQAAANAKLTGSIELQACNDESCFPPEMLKWSIGPEAPTTVPTSTVSATPATALSAEATPVVSSLTIVGFNLSKNAYPLAFAAAFLVGILFNLMPCVLPVLPLKIMGFYEASQHHRGKSLALGAVFSAGLICSFGVLAIMVVALHTLDWGGLFQQTWFTVTIVAVLTAMAINLFGVFTMNLPAGIYQFAPRHDTYSGNFLFGILTAALSTPCTFGMFVTLLAWTAQQPASIGVLLIMTVGVGMAFPYFVLSGFPQVARNFPRTGRSSELIRQLLGFLVLATAVYFAQPLFERFVSDGVFWWTIFAVVAAGGILAIIRTFEFAHTGVMRGVWTMVAVAVMIVAGLAARRFASQPYAWIAYSDTGLAQARASGKPVLIDFTAAWCGNCHFIEGYVLNSAEIVSAVKRGQVTMIKADMTNSDAPGSILLKKFSPSGAIPLTLVFHDAYTEPIKLDGIYSAGDLQKAIGG